MNNLARLVGRLSVLTAQKSVTNSSCSFFSRGFASLLPSAKTQAPTSSLLMVKPLDNQPSRNYKPKAVLKRRCAGCYFERRFGRLYVECTLKPRHKQMQWAIGRAVFKDHYSKGRWWKAVHWGFKGTGRLHKWGDKSEFSKYDWLEGRLGKDI